MNVVDSSAWIEYFVDGPNADYFAKPVEKVGELIIPSLCLYEVFRWVLRERDEMQALKAMAQMRMGSIIDLDAQIAISAARLGLDLKIALGDSVVLATAHSYSATVWTQDSDFEKIPGVNYKAKQNK